MVANMTNLTTDDQIAGTEPLLTSGAVAKKNGSMKLTRANLDRLILGDVWAFGPAESDECWGKIVFLPYGRTFGYDHPNEYGWDFKAGTLRLKRKDGEPTSVYDNVVVNNSRPRLFGKSLLSPGSVFRLERMDPENW